MTVCIGQFGAAADKAANLRTISVLAQESAKRGASMLFLPEYSMFYAEVNAQSLFSAAAEPLDGSFVAALSAIARQHGLWLAAGLFEQSDGLPYNTVVLLDGTGALRAFYRKQKLYDAFGYCESALCRAGDTPFTPVETPVGRLGLITCFELRFPALAAAQKAGGADVLFVPAGWARGENKLLHWRTLLAARAIENGFAVLGAGQSSKAFIGHSAAFAPDGTPLGALAEGEGLLSISL